MARSDRKRGGARAGVAGEYGNATASDIARFGVRGRPAGDGRPIGDAAGPATPSAPASDAGHADAAGFEAAERTAGAGGAGNWLPAPERAFAGGARVIPIAVTDALAKEERRLLRRKVAIWAVVLILLCWVSLGIFGATTSPAVGYYKVFSPIEVAQVLFDHVYNFVGSVTHLFSPMSTKIYSNEYLYYGVFDKAGVVGITLVCAVLLSVSGMLYQNVFKNPIAGPGMLGVSSGVSLGMTIMVWLYGGEALSMAGQRYLWCYGLGAAILVFVILAGRKLSGKGKPFDIVTMLLVGSIVSQLSGFVITYVTMYVMDPDLYQVYLTVSQMLTVDTSNVSWTVLLIVTVISMAPIVYLRFRMNALAFDEQEVRLLGINFTMLRAVALVCGAMMILAAQVHIGGVAMVSLIVPFLSRSWFGCEFRKQLVGNVCISTILLLVCRDIVDLVPFVGDGLGIGSIVSVVALPVFLLIMARHMRGWE